MDIAVFDTVTKSEKGVFLHLEHPVTGEPLYEGEFEPGETPPDEARVGIWMQGPDSKAFRSAQRALADERAKRTKVTRGGKVKETMTAEEEARRGIEINASTVIRFQHIELDGKPALRSDAIAVFTKYPAIHRRADRFIDAEENWLGESSTS